MGCIGISENGNKLALTMRRVLSMLNRNDIGVKLAESESRFDVILIGTPPPQRHSKFSAKLLIIPDCMDTSRLFSPDATNIITYGLRQRNTVTASSLIGSRLVVSVQHEIQTLSGEFIDEQELVVGVENAEHADDLLGIISTLLTLGISTNEISKLTFRI